jgi:hypothetical protein
MDLLIDQTTGDIVLEDGDLVFTDSVIVETAQRCAIRYRTERGEWVYDVTMGLPYQAIFQGADDRTVENFFVASASQVDTVQSVRRVQIDRTPSELDASVTVETVDGQTVEVSL